MRAIACALALLVACKDKPASEPTPGSAAPGTPAIDLADPLALVPADADMIVKLDVAALRKSPLWNKYRGQVLEFLAPSFSTCDYNPLDEITTITAGFPLDEQDGVFVIRNVDAGKVRKCLKGSTVESNTSVTFDGDYITLTNKSGAVNLVKFVDDRTIVMQGSKGPTKETLAKAISIGAPLRKDAATVAVLAEISPTAAVAFLSRPGSKRASELVKSRLGYPVEAFTFAVEATDKVALHAVMKLPSPAEATEVALASQPQVDQAKSFFESAAVKVDGAQVKVDMVATEAQIAQIAQLVQSMRPR